MNEVTQSGKHWVMTALVCTSIRHQRFEAVERYHPNQRAALVDLTDHLWQLTEARFDIEAFEHARRQRVNGYLYERGKRGN